MPVFPGFFEIIRVFKTSLKKVLTFLGSSDIIIELTPKGVSKEAKTVQEKIKKFLTMRKSFGKL